jgi:hypothetical protein
MANINRTSIATFVALAAYLGGPAYAAAPASARQPAPGKGRPASADARRHPELFAPTNSSIKAPRFAPQTAGNSAGGGSSRSGANASEIRYSMSSLLKVGGGAGGSLSGTSVASHVDRGLRGASSAPINSSIRQALSPVNAALSQTRFYGSSGLPRLEEVAEAIHTAKLGAIGSFSTIAQSAMKDLTKRICRTYDCSVE